jgi:hypothetical protein
MRTSDTMSHRLHAGPCDDPWTLVQGCNIGATVRRGRTRSGWLAWMALVAVWLTALAPTVSRTAEAFAFPDLGAWCESAPGDHHGRGHETADADAACGYCTLFAQQPTLAGSFFIGHVHALSVPALAISTAVRHGPAPLTIHASPRGPPSAAHA